MTPRDLAVSFLKEELEGGVPETAADELERDIQKLIDRFMEKELGRIRREHEDATDAEDRRLDDPRRGQAQWINRRYG